MLGIPMFSRDGRLFFGKVLVFSLMVMVLSGTGHALPELSGLLATPNQVWVGENVILSVICTDNESAIQQVYADIIGPGIIIPSLDFSEYENSTFMLSVSDFYGKIGEFSAAVYCTSENGTANQNTTFSVSEFSGEISSVSPDNIYVGDTVEVDFFAKKDGVYISSGVVFNISLNGVSVPLAQPAAYDFEKGWRIRFEAPQASGTYDVKVAAFYEGAVFEETISIEVNDVFEFALTAVDTSEVLSGENITATIFASEHGNPISISKSSISAKIGSYAVDVADISLASSGKYVATITLPSLTPAAYGLKITFSHQNFTAERTTTITYLVSASGTLLDPNGGAVSAKLSFMSGALERYVYTDSKGAYSMNILSRTYDVRLVHDRASIVQQGVSVSEFDDPLRFYYVADIVISGIKPAGLFMFETTLSADDTEITLNYDARKVSSDESGLVVYRCGNWNLAEKKCSGSWDTISASIDPVRNSAKFSSANPSGAYTIGSLDALFLDFSIDKTTYYVGDVIKAVGISEKSGGNYVGDIEITGRINAPPNTKTVTSSEKGVFALDLEVPSAEGNYTLIFTAELEPYQSYEITKEIEVIRKKEISVVLPDTVRMGVGENSTIEVPVVNTGQAPLVDGKISVSGIPEDYYTITPELLSVDAGEETKFFINFEIPELAPKTTHGADITIPFGEKTFKKTFALTIKEPVAEEPVVEAPDAENNDSFALPTGFLTSVAASDLLYLVVLSAISFSTAIFLRNRRTLRTSEPGDNGFGRKAYLFEIKKAVEKGFGAKLKKVVKRKRTVKKSVSKKPTKVVKRKHTVKKAVRKVARRKK